MPSLPGARAAVAGGLSCRRQVQPDDDLHFRQALRMPPPSTSALLALVDAVDKSDLMAMLDHMAVRFALPDGIEPPATADVLLILLREAVRCTARAEQTAMALTRREREVANLLAHGLCNEIMARRLGCTERTVRAHLESMQRKTGARNRTALLAVLRGLDIGVSANIRR